MKRIVYISLLFLLCFALTGCSLIEGALKKVPFFEDADLDGLTDKAEKAWEEVGKDALDDAVDSAKDAIMGNNKTAWPETPMTKNIPVAQFGTLSKVYEKDSLCEITVSEVSQSAYLEYVSQLESSLGEPYTNGIYKTDNRLVYVQYSKNDARLVITISTIKTVSPSINESEDNSSSENGDS